jgi:hypothetical protein
VGLALGGALSLAAVLAAMSTIRIRRRSRRDVAAGQPQPAAVTGALNT